MICKHARLAIIERELEPLSASRETALTRHLGRCPGCASVARAEARLAVDLATLREEYPFELDVRARVEQSIRARGTPHHDEVTVRQLGWAAAAAAFVALLLLGFSREMAPEVLRMAQDALAAAAGLSDATSQLTSAGATLLAIPIKLLGTLAGYATRFGGTLARVQPFAIAVAGVLTATMTVVIAWVVGRDLLPHGVSRQ
jgi:hypothetical protein